MARSLPTIARTSDWAFFLDLDGTLLEITDEPDRVTVPSELPALLRHLAEQFSGAVAILTGRTITDADRLLGPVKLAAAGVHGAELRRRPGGTIHEFATPIEPALAMAVRKLGRLSPHVVVEHKGTGIAVHFRRAPAVGPAVKAALTRLAGEQGHARVRSGRMVCEILSPGPGKEAALQHMLAAAPFRGRRPVMIGDDRTDEAAIALATRLGGAGLKVGGEHFAARECHFDSPTHVRSWLKQIVQRTMG